MKSILSTTNDRTLTFLRMVLGLVMFPHGAQKLLGWFGGRGFEATMAGMSKTLPAPIVLLVIAAEFFGSLALIFGFLGRLSAFGIAAVMVGAVLTVHLSNGFFMNWMGNQAGEGFEFHLLALGLALPVVFRGSGAWSIDGWLASRIGARRETVAGASVPQAS